MGQIEFPLKVNALKVSQQIGDFYVVVLPASILEKVTFSYPAQYSEEILTGTQRKLKEDRIEQICQYSGTINATFPNAIILGANYNKNGDFVDDDSLRWRISVVGDNYKLIIPTEDAIASIIDGQHRLEGIKKYLKTDPNAEDVDLLCTIFMDLASPFQAEIFATINYTQQQVDKSLAYQLFGYKLDKAESDEWAPETLSVYLSRVLNNDKESPFYNKIKSGLYDAADNDNALFKASDINDIGVLISVLRKQTRVSEYLWGKLDHECKAALMDTNVPIEYKLNTLVDGLNKLVFSSMLFDSQIFEGVSLSEETKLLLKMNAAKYRARLNRRLLEDIFQNEISKACLPDVGVWSVSTAAIVEGVTKLYSSKPIEDRYRMHKKTWFGKGRRVLKDYQDKAPLRAMYIDNNDKGIYEIIVNYFKAVDELLWSNDDNIFIIKTIGILASFDALRHILTCQEKPSYCVDYFKNLLADSVKIDFSDNYFHASGSGRSRVKNTILLSLRMNSEKHLKLLAGIKDKYFAEYERLVNN